ncbi:MAG: sulfotransferase domain-containing protein [Acidimicrobiales bacterium]|jgi:hypothetical protein|nr:sulfotransferase domain-containing protein [Acidimicrobiales bacterium]
MTADAAPRVGRLPTCLVVGAQKAGTSSLAELLGAHPDIGRPHRKELHYFDRRHDRGLGWYAARFRGVEGAAAFEATPAYLYDPEVPGRIVAALGYVGIVAVLRNPVDRAYSHYWHAVRVGAVRGTFEQALADEPAALARGRGVDLAWRSLVDRGRYAAQLERYAAHFGWEQLHVILFEDLVADPQEVADGVARFVGVAPLGPSWPVQVHRNRAARSRLPPVLRPVVRAAPHRVRPVVRALTMRPWTPPAMDPRTRGELLAAFAPDNERLTALLGRPLPQSWFPSAPSGSPSRAT